MSTFQYSFGRFVSELVNKSPREARGLLGVSGKARQRKLKHQIRLLEQEMLSHPRTATCAASPVWRRCILVGALRARVFSGIISDGLLRYPCRLYFW
jgi:hypothetical protein